ncbi:telomere repeats-binding bouquet formation protein 1 isoform X1 [Peromyscus californicus insignis]|uniref:telomere repeats-binding bouquet formation protein 1 isoform X1 n=2 Tax=Peromyscus californicus insignis TaxID=564181 RepID=UPI0022A7E09F|nr:telomere repeats-binding bouquet formation protein 1 isoform X1 [Peromyscus californicus insignis]XP_052583696.1 telomere repeats-binding bouquet formation protein 1 isoform X1 [Peromyscus californicus insignis]XP_052583697.1 telomere repeats-binding bouquet formation protein 1 isoform X1 [Peromyscus californicus insignis]
MESENTKKIQEMKTDLNLLLECLKYHMGNPLSQKEVLITIHSVCQQNSDAGVYFREIGGLVFVKNLAKSSEHSMVKEAALYTLGSIVEENVYCQQTLCTSELFQDLTLLLSNDDSNTNLKRMSIYVLLVLVSNNRNGQTLVRETGCIEVLSQLFRTVLSNYELNLSDNNVFQSYLLWSSVCSTLCVCVNNPQNDENQILCCSLFPYANEWLMNCMKPEIIRPICSFIGLTLANNTHVQNCFVSSGGLDVLSQVLVQLESDSHNTFSSAKLAVVVTKTVDACITNNLATFSVVLSKYHIVSKLLALLLHESLDSGEKFSIILAIGHCTEDCEENQYELLKNNGLPLMIQALTEFNNEELNKAATYVLQNCKTITEKLSLSLGENSFDENEADQLKDINEKENLEEHWKAAKEIICRIKQFEREGKEEKLQSGQYKDNTSSMKIKIQNTLKHLCADSIGGTKAENKDTNQSKQRPSYKSSGIISKACANENQMKTLKKNTNPLNPCYRERGQSKSLHKATSSCTQILNEKMTFNQKDSVSQSSDHVFKHLTHTVKNRKQQVPVTDPFTLCLDIIDKEVGFQATDKMLNYRCSGCIVVRKLNSRNFSKLLHSCAYQCDHHKVIMEAEDKYKSELRKGFICDKEILLTPRRRRQLSKESTAPEGLKPTHQKPDSQKLPDLEEHACNTNIPEAKARRFQVPGQHGLHKKRRIRKNFTKEEVNYLLHGVKKMGNHWNSILWSFPFQEGRRAVDLAHKYYKLIRSPNCAAI